MFKVQNKSTRKRCNICSKLNIRILEQRCSGVFNVNFEHISHVCLMFLLLKFNRSMFAGNLWWYLSCISYKITRSKSVIQSLEKCTECIRNQQQSHQRDVKWLWPDVCLFANFLPISGHWFTSTSPKNIQKSLGFWYLQGA